MMVVELNVKYLGNDGLKGQQLSAQGNTLGNRNRRMCNTPCKGKSTNISIRLLPLQGEFSLTIQNPGHRPGL